jgi:hypothetical protein
MEVDAGIIRESDSGDGSGDNGETSGIGVSLEHATVAAESTGRVKRKRRTREQIELDNAAGGIKLATPGTKARKKESFALDLGSLNGMFVAMHMMLAQLSGVEELAITPDEGDAFMKSAQNVARHYSVATTQKTLDWIAFAGCTAGMYVPRGIAVAAKRRSKKQASEPVAFSVGE